MLSVNDSGFYFYDGTNYKKFKARLLDLTRHFQIPIQANEMTINIDKGTPAPRFAEVVFVVRGIHIFHGIITKVDDLGNYQKLYLKSMEYLLDYRVIPQMIYHAASLNSVFASGIPSTVPGLLTLINGCIPGGAFDYYSATVSKLADGGLKSCFGSLPLHGCTSYPNAGSVDGLDGVVQLTDAGAIPTADDTYYRTTDDLYVRLGDGSYRENAYVIMALNWCDTRIRLGTIDIGTYVAATDFSLPGQASSKINEFVANLGREPEFLPWQDGTLRFNLAEEIPGRSSETSPIRTYRNNEGDAKIYLTNQDIPDVQAAVSYSTDPAEAQQAVSGWDWRGIQLIQGYENTGYTQEEVQRSLQSIIDNNELSVQVVTPKVDYFLRPGDWIGLYHESVGNFALRIKEWAYSNGLMTLTCGKQIFSLSSTFGKYLRRSIPDYESPLTISALTDGAGGFTISAAHYATGGLRVYYTESFQEDTDGSTIDTTSFITLEINDLVVPPGRIKLSGGGDISVDITDHCLKSAVSDQYNTVTRTLYHGTGWTGSDSYVKQYRGIQFVSP